MWKFDEKFRQGNCPDFMHHMKISTGNFVFFSKIIYSFFFGINFRPPPKVARRVGPIADAPSSTTTTIIETPPSPSMHASGRGAGSHSPSNNQSNCSLDSNVKPSQFLRHKHHDDKPPLVLLKHSHGSISKSAQNSSSESLINSTNNEETLHVESFPISERVWNATNQNINEQQMLCC